MKKIILTLVIAVFGVLTITTPTAYADPGIYDGTDGSPKSNEEIAEEQTQEHARSIRINFMLYCQVQGTDLAICQARYELYLRAYYNYRLALLNKELSAVPDWQKYARPAASSQPLTPPTPPTAAYEAMVQQASAEADIFYMECTNSYPSYNCEVARSGYYAAMYDYLYYTWAVSQGYQGLTPANDPRPNMSLFMPKPASGPC